MAIQIQGTTVIDDTRYISGALGINSPTFGFSTFCKSNVVMLPDNNLNIGVPTSSAYYCKLTASTILNLQSNNTLPTPTSSAFVEQVLLILDVASGGDLTYSTIYWSSTAPVLKPNNRYFMTLSRVRFASGTTPLDGLWCAAISQPYYTIL